MNDYGLSNFTVPNFKANRGASMYLMLFVDFIDLFMHMNIDAYFVYILYCHVNR